MVDGLERELVGRARVVRLNVDDRAGVEARARFGIEKVPAIILLDANGVQRYRTEGKLPRRRAILDALASTEKRG
jgi:thioredoxin-like negative regulator of GroEL